jgi:hypothetical protein
MEKVMISGKLEKGQISRAMVEMSLSGFKRILMKAGK